MDRALVAGAWAGAERELRRSTGDERERLAGVAGEGEARSAFGGGRRAGVELGARDDPRVVDRPPSHRSEAPHLAQTTRQEPDDLHVGAGPVARSHLGEGIHDGLFRRFGEVDFFGRHRTPGDLAFVHLEARDQPVDARSARAEDNEDDEREDEEQAAVDGARLLLWLFGRLRCSHRD